MVGVTATLTHAAILMVLTSMGWNPSVSTGLAFLVALGVTYGGQSLWVFEHNTHNTLTTGRFVLVALMGLLGNVSIMFVATEMFQWHPLAGLAMAVVTIPAATFVINKHWVFKNNKTF